jgi:hypothetical protein
VVTWEKNTQSVPTIHKDTRVHEAERVHKNSTKRNSPDERISCVRVVPAVKVAAKTGGGEEHVAPIAVTKQELHAEEQVRRLTTTPQCSSPAPHFMLRGAARNGLQYNFIGWRIS